MQTLKFNSQPSNAFFAGVNRVFGGSSQLPTTAERVVIKLLCTVQTIKQCLAVVVSWEDPPNIWLTATKNAFVGWPWKFWVCMLLKRAMVFDAILTGRQSVEKLLFLWESDGKYLITNLNWIFHNLWLRINKNTKILGKRLYSPSLEDVAWLEDVQLIFLIFHTFFCVFCLDRQASRCGSQEKFGFYHVAI